MSRARAASLWVPVLAFHSIIVLGAAGMAGAQTCEPAQPCGDVNGSGSVTTGDALSVLRASVGQEVGLACECTLGAATCPADLATCTSDLAACTSNFEGCGQSLYLVQEELAACEEELGECQTSTCGNGIAEGGEACDDTDLRSRTCADETPETGHGLLACNEDCTAFVTSGCVARFELQSVDGDDTVLDHETGLEWVRTDDDGGLTDKDNVYTWSATVNAMNAPPDGTVFTVYIAGLNAANYGGHDDWRLPTSAGCCGYTKLAPAEIESIEDRSIGICAGGFGVCIDQGIFGPTSLNAFWSASVSPQNYLYAYTKGYWGDEPDYGGGKWMSYRARAVRGGP